MKRSIIFVGLFAALFIAIVSGVFNTVEATDNECAPEYIYENQEVEVGTEYFHKHFLYVINHNTKWWDEVKGFPWVYTGDTRPVYETQQVKVLNPDFDPLCGQETPTVEPTPEITPEPTVEPTPEVTPTPEVPEPTETTTPEPVPYEEPVVTPTATPEPTVVLVPAVSTESYCVDGDMHTFTYEDGVVVSTEVEEDACAVEVTPTPTVTVTETVPAPRPADTGYGVAESEQSSVPMAIGLGLVTLTLAAMGRLAYRKP